MTTSQERIIPTDLRGEMSRSYLEYAMSVIVGRALPDARDGLKPVHRRILYAMHELGLLHDRPFRKCARVVGEVLGKYHPHGDTAVYDALVRMAQDFSMRSPLISGHGNFGSVDNDPPAAMRYTECRLHALTSVALLQDIEAETVDFADNFDGSQQEPTVLPSRIPQLLLNGSSGIAVGMATNIPPHNLGELIDGLVALIHNPEITDIQLMQYIHGPDFPTGAQILGVSGIKEAYTTGRGSITMRGVANIETIAQRNRPEREAIIITELPYQTNKAALIEKIAELVNDKRIDGIADIRDESDRDGMRIVIELKRDAYPRVVLNNLYKQTPLQSNFGANMLALVNSEPQTLNLKRFLSVFLDFRILSIERRTRYELRKAQERDHLLQGLLIALSRLDAIIVLIRHAPDAPTAKGELITTYGLSEVQADAILQMQLRRLTALEADKIRLEHEDLQVKIGDLEDILARRERVLEIIETEISQIKTSFATPRRTVITHGEGDIDDIDLIANEKAIILVTEQGYIKRMPVNTFESQSRATRGKAGAKVKDDDTIEHFLTCCDHDSILFFSDRGVVYSLKAYQIPVGSRTSRGTPIVQMLPIPKEEKITSIVPVDEFSSEEYLVMLTKGGNIKKTVLEAFSHIRANGLIAISLEEGDQLRWVRRARVEDSIIIGSRQGMAIHFRCTHDQLRPLGRATRGVKSMKLKNQDELIGMDILPAAILDTLDTGTEAEIEEIEETAEIEETLETTDIENSEEIAEVTNTNSTGPWVLVITMGGYGKRVPVSQFRLQNRAGQGLMATKFKNRKTKDKLATLRIVNSDDEIMMATNRGIIIRQAVNAISIQSRSATGVKVQRLDEDDAITGVAIVPPDTGDTGELEEAE
ncbi:DNA topoisomerase (ATP-hydrolyzing) subunit A [Dolichospermum sp. LEGE 00240]|uniref:DNA topoisomerase (ATP-hydrolyzing) subunit A n=1 Tax=Dolichospermum sp. LEGE 00240 TaxID=1828603 RepID=UPI001880FF32|nr:DNA topoisomerase (ATP-hydrolyzing) subunit A [Dolichospermum sp. LEGE 00240]MDM3847493.1 DNA topoisomerase (ATP-hydrolyzing) subunit A [Aphanizomenon gracile PMC638.10]MDM3853081.1 DNA topoisomerase (ATP-hydrolyzing) subunit A [Aphanizomenon gracile PMC627.10]MDM3853602.1 DNA topoisomerase (ATP-hydrolyzing) subunit A [Aphanizomenon gracile PMC649.10]MDM3861389.1 DNA topoisomerase (ATP-hydrolyzing) subunit A [Aphanizomenon gracile PMC644.10]MBE9250865.1 DNA topoisomerase (ATP-hydrolyzing) s